MAENSVRSGPVRVSAESGGSAAARAGGTAPQESASAATRRRVSLDIAKRLRFEPLQGACPHPPERAPSTGCPHAGYDPRPRAVSRHARLLYGPGQARGGDRPDRRGPVQARLHPALGARPDPDRLWLRPLPAGGHDPGLVAAALDPASRGAADAVRLHQPRGDLPSRPSPRPAQAPDAAGREDLGDRPPAGQRRSRLDPAVRLLPRLGGGRPHQRQAPRAHGRPSGAAAWRAGRTGRLAQRRPRRGRRRRGVVRVRQVPAPAAHRRRRLAGAGLTGRSLEAIALERIPTKWEPVRR
ncbi:protein of unknown function [Methylorubrum extorquens]|uniref:Uncharacterized protein n=1 Tax=Methylorubrum extorquens TaxID=408 RepID=A0A2N9ALK4_METEX|nr:protein of unknown function [Methylorubrum extorquens]